MAFTLSDIETEVREAAQDLDSANYGISQAILWRVWNDAYVNLKVHTEDRVRDLTATASGLTLAANDTAKTITAVNIRRILHAFRASTAGGTVPIAELERLEPWEVQLAQLNDATAGPVTAYGAFRVGTAVVADVGKWTFMPWRIPTATTYILLRVEVEPTRLTTGTDSPDLTEVEAYATIHAAAAICARRLRRPSAMIEELWGRVPEAMQAALGRQDAAEPRRRPQEPPA